MTDAVLPNLPAATPLTGPELLYGVQNLADRKVTAAQIKTYVSGTPLAVNFVDKFGGKGDGVTDNAPMLMAFNTWAKAESAAGRAVFLDVPPGTYNFNHKYCQNYLQGIRKLYMRGYAAIFQNTYDRLTDPSGNNAGFEWPWGPPTFVYMYNGVGPKINNTVPGATTVTLKTLADHTQFAVGDWIVVTSLDIQYYGIPPNPDLFEFTQITAINTTTGVLTVFPIIRNEHRDDYPDGGDVHRCGVARIWQTRSGDAMWDIDHTYEGLEIRIAPNTDLSYMNISGQRFKLLNCIVPGTSPSVCERFEMIGGVATGFNEPDKIVTSCLYDNVWIKNELRFQSSSIDHVIVRNCRVDGVLASGCAKNVLIENCDVNYYSEGVAGQPYGIGRRTTILGGRIRGGGFSGLGQGIAIDGTNVSYANGTFAVLKAGALYLWGIPPGTILNLIAAAHGAHSGNLGTGVVVRIYEDATKVYFETTLPYATLPAWANGDVSFKRNGRLTAFNVTGCLALEQASAACAAGKNPGEVHELLILNPAGQGGNDVAGKFGKLVRARFDVIKPMAGSRLRNTGGGAMLAAEMTAANEKLLEFTIDTTVTGTRDVTVAALTGKTPNDTVKLLNSDYSVLSELTALPADRWCTGGFDWFFDFIDVAGSTAAQLPIVRIRWEYEQGLWTQILLNEKDASGSVAFDLVGQL